MKESVAHVQSLIDEKKNELMGVEGQIESLRKERARTEASKPGSLARVRAIESIDDEIANLLRQKQNAPFEIETLQTRLEQAKKDEDYDREILKGAPSLSESQKLSKILLKQLEAAKQTSDRLIAMRQARDLIRRQTEQPLGAPCTCSGFHSLKLLIEMCSREVAGGGRTSRLYKNLPEQVI